MVWLKNILNVWMYVENNIFENIDLFIIQKFIKNDGLKVVRKKILIKLIEKNHRWLSK